MIGPGHMMSSEEIQVTWESFVAETKTGLVVADFWAPRCPPSRTQSSIVDRIAAQLGGKVKIVRCNVDAERDLALAWEIKHVPTLLILKDGVEVRRLTGLRPESEILVRLEEHLD